MASEYWIIPRPIAAHIDEAFGNVSYARRPNTLKRYIDKLDPNSELFIRFKEWKPIDEKNLRYALNIGNVYWGIRVVENNTLTLDLLCAYAYSKISFNNKKIESWEDVLKAYELKNDNIYVRPKQTEGWSNEYHNQLISTNCIKPIVEDLSIAETNTPQIDNITYKNNTSNSINEELLIPESVCDQRDNSTIAHENSRGNTENYPQQISKSNISSNPPKRKVIWKAVTVFLVLIVAVSICFLFHGNVLEYRFEVFNDTAFFHIKNKHYKKLNDVDIKIQNSVLEDVIFTGFAYNENPLEGQRKFIYPVYPLDSNTIDIQLKEMPSNYDFIIVVPFRGKFDQPSILATFQQSNKITTIPTKKK